MAPPMGRLAYHEIIDDMAHDTAHGLVQAHGAAPGNAHGTPRTHP